MTPRERVGAALRHEQPDLCPWAIGFTQGARARMVEYTGDPDFEAKLGNHVGGFGPILPMEQDAECPNFWQDEFGVRWNRSIDKDIGNPDGLIFPEPYLADYQWPDPHDPRRYEHLDEQIAAYSDKFMLLSIGFSLFERAWAMRGMVNLMMDMHEHPTFVDELLDAICQFNLGLIENGCRDGIDGVMFGDDWGQQQGMLMGPPLWRRFIKPRLKQMYDAAHAAGKQVFIHCCGNIVEVLPELIELGVAVFNPFQPEVMDVYEIKRQYGKHLSFYGGVSTQQLLPYGTPEQVKAAARRLMREVGRDGGYIIAPAHSIPKDVPAENMAALIEAVQDQ